MSFFRGGVAVVTGAGSGIGRALAQQLAAKGSALALADIDQEGLAGTADSLPKKKAEVTTHIVDVSDEAAVSAFAREVVERHDRVTLLINNAGVVLYGTSEEISLDDLRWVMGINFWGVVYGTKYFLPVLKQQKKAHIVNVSSVVGLIAPPGQCAYTTSKFAVRGFTECLRHELEGTAIGVSCVHPGAIRTAIARRSRVGAGTPPERKEQAIPRFENSAKTSAEAAAQTILRGVERREPRIIVGADARRLDAVQRKNPATYWKVLTHNARRAKS